MKYSHSEEAYISELVAGAQLLYETYEEERRQEIASRRPSVRYSLKTAEPPSSEDFNKSIEKLRNDQQLRYSTKGKNILDDIYTRPDRVRFRVDESEPTPEQKEQQKSISRKLLIDFRKKEWGLFDYIEWFVNKILGKKQIKDFSNLYSYKDIPLAPSFGEMLLDKIREKNLTNPEVYHAARIDRKYFSKIISSHFYKPSRAAAISLCFALKLDLEETSDLLATAGYLLSRSSKSDVIVEYFIRNRNYNLDDLNEVLYRLGEQPLS